MAFVMANEMNADIVIGNAAFFQFWNDVANKILQAAPGKLTLLATVDDIMKTVNAGNPTMIAANLFWAYNAYRGDQRVSRSYRSEAPHA